MYVRSMLFFLSIQYKRIDVSVVYGTFYFIIVDPFKYIKRDFSMMGTGFYMKSSGSVMDCHGKTLGLIPDGNGVFTELHVLRKGR